MWWLLEAVLGAGAPEEEGALAVIAQTYPGKIRGEERLLKQPLRLLLELLIPLQLVLGALTPSIQ
jgi:hypothetical protein